jgi:hypothetical protein
MWLAGFELDPVRRGQGGRLAASLRVAGDADAAAVAAWAARGWARAGSALGAGAAGAAERAAAAAAVLAASVGGPDAARAWASSCAAMDAGVATRGADDARLREASRAGDVSLLASSLGDVSAGRRCSSVDARDEYGRTALFVAAQNGHVGAVELLLRHGAQLQAAVAYGGCAAADAAAAAGFHAVAAMLRAAETAAAETATAAETAAAEATAAKAFHPDAASPAAVAGDRLVTVPAAAAAAAAAAAKVPWRAGLPTATSTTAEACGAVRELLPWRGFGGHPGCGSAEVDAAVTSHEARALVALWRDWLPEVRPPSLTS